MNDAELPGPEQADLTVTGEVWYWRGPAPFHFLRISGEDADDLRSIAHEVTYGWGMIPVTAVLAGTRWTTSLFPKDGGYLIPLKDAVRAAENVEEGSAVTVSLFVTGL